MRRFLRKLSFSLLCLTGLWGGQIPLLGGPFEDGNALFKEGKFKEAEVAYNRSLAQEGDSPATRYNLGKVQESLADPARAMLEWERALRLAPDYTAAQKALQAARETMGSKVAAVPWWNALQPSTTRHREAWIAALGAWLLATGLTLAFATKHRLGAAILGGFGVVFGLAGVAWLAQSRSEADIALVLERSVVFRASPANPARALDSLPAGSRLRILDTSGGWLRAEAADRQIGWVPAESVERISP